MKTTIRLCLTFVFLLALSASSDQDQQTAGSPNILLILADDLGYGDTSSYGGTDIKTPNIDRIVESGMKFTRGYANCPVCSPSRAAILTGRYPDTVGVPGVIRTHKSNSWGYLSQEFELLPLLLKRADYHTAAIGKWHLGLEPENSPNSRGFDYFAGFLGDMMDNYYTHRRHGINYMRINEREVDPKGHATEVFTSWAIDYIRGQSESTQPFFLYLAYNAPHTPIQPPEEWIEKVLKRERGMSRKRARLVALIEHMDNGIGDVLNALENAGVYKNTLIIFTSDNGGKLGVGANNGPLRGGKQDMYEGGIRVPLAASWPGHIKPGSVSSVTVLGMDLFPTICNAAGTNPPESIDGKSILPLLTGNPAPALDERTLFWVRREGGLRYQGQDYYAVREGKWKLLHNSPFEPLQLFDLENDPGETDNLANSNRRMFKDLSIKLRSQIQRAGGVPWFKP